MRQSTEYIVAYVCNCEHLEDYKRLREEIEFLIGNSFEGKRRITLLDNDIYRTFRFTIYNDIDYHIKEKIEQILESYSQSAATVKRMVI